MLFSSITFLFLFLPIMLAVYYIAPYQWKNLLLLAGSLIFYAWGEPVYIILMILSILLNYFCGMDIENKSENEAKAKRSLVFAITVNIVLLVFFKYFGFLVESTNTLFGISIPYRELALPIGISFYTFQEISYIVDVYRGKVKAQQSLVKYALYVSMFPQLVAGPIVCYGDIEKQLTARKISGRKLGQGAMLFIIGLAKKAVLANTMGKIFEQIASTSASSLTVLMAWLGCITYAFQIYFDFSGYSDMAIGLGRMFGFRFPKNFDYPYIAASITEFWRRWHMTLGTWFREYVYIPLGGNRVTVAKHIRNLLIVWGLTGIWHGAGINFLLWGLYYGVLLIIEKYLIGGFLKKHKVIGHTFTLIAVVIGWMLFANTSFASLGQYFCMMFGIGKVSFFNATAGYFLRTSIVLLVLGVLFSTPIMHQLGEQIFVRYPKISAAVRVFLFLLCIAALVYQTYNPFLYFRF